jgi:hypothetical protein
MLSILSGSMYIQYQTTDSVILLLHPAYMHQVEDHHQESSKRLPFHGEKNKMRIDDCGSLYTGLTGPDIQHQLIQRHRRVSKQQRGQ